MTSTALPGWRRIPTAPSWPHSLPEDAFRPLADWVDYVLDHESQALRAWVQAAQFDFEGFICSDEESGKPKKKGESKRGEKKQPQKTGEDGPADLSAYAPPTNTRQGKAPEPEADPYAALVPAEPSEAQKRLKALEEQFVAAEGGLDNPARLALWPELASLNAALGGNGDASVCWMNFLWRDNHSAQSPAWSWFRAEAAAVVARPEAKLPKGRSWILAIDDVGREGKGDHR